MSTSRGFFNCGGITLHLNSFANIHLIVIRNSRPSGLLQSSRRLIMWHIMYKRMLLLLLMSDSRFLKDRYLFFFNCCHRRTYNRYCNYSVLYYRCNINMYCESWHLNHWSRHIYSFLLKTYLSRYRALPGHRIL
jgi:hypothetical protein